MPGAAFVEKSDTGTRFGKILQETGREPWTIFFCSIAHHP